MSKRKTHSAPLAQKKPYHAERFGKETPSISSDDECTVAATLAWQRPLHHRSMNPEVLDCKNRRS
jgi:hypothetical protein